MTLKPQNFRLNATDEKHIKKIMKAYGLTTKVSAIRLALHDCWFSKNYAIHTSAWEREANIKETEEEFRQEKLELRELKRLEKLKQKGAK